MPHVLLDKQVGFDARGQRIFTQRLVSLDLNGLGYIASANIMSLKWTHQPANTIGGIDAAHWSLQRLIAEVGRITSFESRRIYLTGVQVFLSNLAHFATLLGSDHALVAHYGRTTLLGLQLNNSLFSLVHTAVLGCIDVELVTRFHTCLGRDRSRQLIKDAFLHRFHFIVRAS